MKKKKLEQLHITCEVNDSILVKLNIKENVSHYQNTKLFKSLSNFALIKESFIAIQQIKEQDITILCSQLKYLPLLVSFTICCINNVKNVFFPSLKLEMINLPNLHYFTFSNNYIKNYFKEAELFNKCIVRTMWDYNFFYIK